VKARLETPREAMAEFCRRNHIRQLALFGSVLRGDFGAASDVDALVEFEPGHTPGLRFFGMQRELSQLVGRKVDLNAPACLSPYFRDEVKSWRKRRPRMARRGPLVSARHMLGHAREAVEMVRIKEVQP